MTASLEQFLESALAASEKSSEKLRLCAAQEVAELQDAELRRVIETFYSANKTKVRWLGTLLNSCFFEQKVTFLLSKSILSDLVANDPNLRRACAANGCEYADFWAYAVGNKFIRVIKLGTMGRGGKASLVELTNASVVEHFDKMFGKDYRERQSTAAVEAYESLGSRKAIALPTFSTPEGDGDEEGECEEDVENNIQKVIPALSPTTPREPPLPSEQASEARIRSVEELCGMESALDAFSRRILTLSDREVDFLKENIDLLKHHRNGLTPGKVRQWFNPIMEKLEKALRQARVIDERPETTYTAIKFQDNLQGGRSDDRDDPDYDDNGNLIGDE